MNVHRQSLAAAQSSKSLCVHTRACMHVSGVGRMDPRSIAETLISNTDLSSWAGTEIPNTE